MRPTLLLTISIAMLSMSSFAQSTARKFTLKNSADGQSELTVYLPSPDARDMTGLNSTIIRALPSLCSNIVCRKATATFLYPMLTMLFAR